MIALVVYMLLGLALAWFLLPSYRWPVRLWLGHVLGCVAMMWLPCLPAFFVGYTVTAQRIAVGASAVSAAGLFAAWICQRRGTLRTLRFVPPCDRDAVGLIVSGLLTLFCVYLLHTHVLRPETDGSLWVGQSTYGDLAMHLGFVESLFRQGTFPPEYSIFPGQRLDYPFLVDAASAGLRFFGLSLRMSVIVPSVVMLFCVFFGFWLLADKLTQRLAPTLMSWLLFVSNGGFGFIYFFGKYDFSDIFTGFYTTPTNLVDEDIRWVNVICDMLIPQRTTMAGWCVLLAAIYLLITALEKLLADGSGRRETVLLAVLAGAMPLIHTHSFLALGVLSAVWFFCALPRARASGRLRALITDYVLYGTVCLALAAPQFFGWTMGAVRTGNLLQWHLGWVVGANGALKSWLLFYIMNCGIVFVFMWPVMFFLRGEKLGIFLGAAAIFVLSNLVAFQPNLYDNNKLLYVWYILTDILVCDWLSGVVETAPRRSLRAAVGGTIVALGTLSGALSLLREAVSGYRLFSPSQVAAAEFITENTPADSLFLTSTSHVDPVTVLAGRSIVCGPAMYLFYHGVDYTERASQAADMFRGGELFERYAAEYGVDYVYLSDWEYAEFEVDLAYFTEHWPVVYDAGGIIIFQID